MNEVGWREGGGKGASLARLASAGLPVPGGFHVTVAACHAGMNREVSAAVAAAYSAACRLT